MEGGRGRGGRGEGEEGTGEEGRRGAEEGGAKEGRDATKTLDRLGGKFVSGLLVAPILNVVNVLIFHGCKCYSFGSGAMTGSGRGSKRRQT